MKKVWLFMTTAALALTPVLVSAQQSPLQDGQQHLYTVQLRSDEKSLVYARIVFTNPSTNEQLSTYKFSLPDGTEAGNLTAQQILAKKQTSTKPCTAHETVAEWRTRTSGSLGSYDSTKLCLEPQEASTLTQDEDYNYANDLSQPDRYYSYRSYHQLDSKFEYSDTKIDQSSDGYTVNLSSPIMPKKQGSVLLSFTTDDFIDSGLFGRYDYNVRTLLTSQMIDKATVSINFDEDMYSKQAKQQRTYTENTDGTGANRGMSAGASVDYQSSSLDNLKDSIGTGGVYINSQSSLIPGDMLSVSGVFATSKIGLYTNELFIGLGILLLLGTLIAVGFWRYRQWRKAHPTMTYAGQLDHAGTKDTVKFNQPTKNTLRDTTAITSVVAEFKPQKKWTIIALVSSISIPSTLLVTFFGSVIISALTDNTTEIIFLFCLASLFTGLLLLPLLYTLRYGVRFTFNWAIVHTLVTFMVLILLIAVLSFFQEVATVVDPTYPDYPY